jgi:RNA polymerase sigma-70 factor (ECF subfamily)
MIEGEFIASARAGSTAAFARLVEIYQSPIYNLCYRMLGDPGEAEDAAQEAFLRAYSQLHRYDPGRSFKTWLFSIASHHCIDRLRRRRVIWLGIEDESLLTHPALFEPRPGPEQMAVRREEQAAVQALLAVLAPKDRCAIVMRYWYDMSYEEIARATGSTASAVKSRLHRARVTLGAALQAAEGTRGKAPGDGRALRRSPEPVWGAQAQWNAAPV